MRFICAFEEFPTWLSLGKRHLKIAKEKFKYWCELNWRNWDFPNVSELRKPYCKYFYSHQFLPIWRGSVRVLKTLYFAIGNKNHNCTYCQMHNRTMVRRRKTYAIFHLFIDSFMSGSHPIQTCGPLLKLGLISSTLELKANNIITCCYLPGMKLNFISQLLLKSIMQINSDFIMLF